MTELEMLAWVEGATLEELRDTLLHESEISPFFEGRVGELFKKRYYKLMGELYDTDFGECA